MDSNNHQDDMLDPSNCRAEFYMDILWTPPRYFLSYAYPMPLTSLGDKVGKGIIPLAYAGQHG